MNKTKEQGFSLLEILVAVVVISIGLLGIASLQASAVSATTASGMRGDAAITVSNLTSNMRANRAYWNEQAIVGGSQTITVSVSAGNVSMTGALSATDEDCLDTVCSPEELAAYDLVKWVEFLDSRLLNPRATVTLRSEANELITINLTWIEKANNSTLNASNDTTPVNNTKSYTVVVSL